MIFRVYKNISINLFRFVTIRAFDRQTDLYCALHYTQSHGKNKKLRVKSKKYL